MSSVYKAYRWIHIMVHLRLACQVSTILGQWETSPGTNCGSLGEAEVRIL